MATRDVMDNRIDVWKDQYKDNQTPWRQNSSDTGNYGQVLRGNVRPSDQRLDGPPLPNNLKDEGAVNVYEQPASAPGGAGFGWTAVFDVSEGATDYTRTLGVFEDGDIVQTDWIEFVESPP
jgi:hypothetical protein